MAESPLVHGSQAEQWGGGWHWCEPARGEHFRRCSYCGSIHPDDLAAEPSWRASWADRKYGWPHKFYVDIPNRDPDRLFYVGGLSQAVSGPYAPGGECYTPPGPELVAMADLTPEQRAICERDGALRPDDEDTGRRYFQFGTRKSHFGKFYTIHLADPAIRPEIKTSIERLSGLHFIFAGGKVSWQATAV